MASQGINVKKEEGKVKESNYEFYARTRDHHRCLWEERGERCEKRAPFLTTVLASKVITEGDREGKGGHKSVIKGGYCFYHWQLFNKWDPQELPQEGRSHDVRDEAINAWLEAHAEDPLVKRAQLLAAGKGSTEDKREHLQDLIRMTKGIATPLPYDKAQRHATEEKMRAKRHATEEETV